MQGQQCSHREGGRIMFELLLLLLLLYVGPAVGIDNGVCRADSVKGTAGAEGEASWGQRRKEEVVDM